MKGYDLIYLWGDYSSIGILFIKPALVYCICGFYLLIISKTSSSTDLVGFSTILPFS